MPYRSQVTFISNPSLNADLDPISLATSMPDSAASKLYAVLRAVSGGPPHKFRGGGYWEAMHGEMTGIHEVRIQAKDGYLYRFFCLLRQNEASEEEIVVLAGMRKRKGEKFRAAEYQRVIRIFGLFTSD